MKPAPHDFDDLVQLLALKREDQPPPHFFHGFSSHVIARLETIADAPPPTWWQRCLEAFEGRPLLVAAYCVAVCGLLLAGLSFAQVIRDQMPAAALPEDLLKVVTLREPLSPDKWAAATFTSASFSPGSSTSFDPFANAVPTFFRLNELRLKPQPAALFFNGD